MTNLTCEQKLDLVSARNCLNPEPYRSIEKRFNVDHSTLHNIEPRITAEIKNALTLLKSCPKRLIVKVVLILSLSGQMSSRAIAESIRLIYGKEISHDSVLNVLSIAAKAAKEINHETLKLEKVQSALFDEIFQSQLPILGFADHYSGTILLKKADDRSSDSWVEFLELLVSLGLNPNTIISDGGSGLKSALLLQFGDSAVYVLDLFHFLKKLREAKQKMEGVCYGLINAMEILSAKIQDKRTSEYKKLLKKMNLAIEIFDRYETFMFEIAKHVYLCNHESGQYVDSETLKEELLKIVVPLKEFYENIRKHKKINAARSYIENNLAQLIAYKQNIEKEVRNEFPELSPLIFRYFLPIIENIDRFQRSFENSAAEKYWAEKILDLKHEVMLDGKLSEKKFDSLLNKTGEIADKFAKSNSLIENVNNQIRRFLDTYKSVPSWFCDLYSYYWNHRVFSRGKRKGYAPIELLTNKKLEKSWLELLLDKFPYDKVRISLVTA